MLVGLLERLACIETYRPRFGGARGALTSVLTQDCARASMLALSLPGCELAVLRHNKDRVVAAKKSQRIRLKTCSVFVDFTFGALGCVSHQAYRWNVAEPEMQSAVSIPNFEWASLFLEVVSWLSNTCHKWQAFIINNAGNCNASRIIPMCTSHKRYARLDMANRPKLIVRLADAQARDPYSHV